MKAVVLAALGVVIAAPAFADPCVVRRTESGLASVISADISQNGRTAQKLRLVTGPILSPLTLDPAATGYTMDLKEQAGLLMYRSGASVPEKDWREAGAIATQESGFGIDWPRVYLNGQPVPLRVTFRIIRGGRSEKPVFEGASKRDGVQIVVAEDFEPVPGLVVVNPQGASAMTTTRDFWSSLIKTGEPMILDLYDPAASLHIASASFKWPSPEATQTRYVADVTALRKAFADGTCMKE
jgi:hypothetical protein